jgi:hypothetical protein
MAWKKGESGNAKGRPRSGNSLAEAIRRNLDPDDVYKSLKDIADNSPSDQTRLRALEMLMGFGYKKPAQVLEVGPADPFEDMSEEELRALIAADDAELAQIEDTGPTRLLGASEEAPTGSLGASGAAASPGPGDDVGDSRTTGTNVGGQASARVGVLVRKRAAQDEDSDT